MEYTVSYHSKYREEKRVTEKETNFFNHLLHSAPLFTTNIHLETTTELSLWIILVI